MFYRWPNKLGPAPYLAVLAAFVAAVEAAAMPAAAAPAARSWLI